jgi:hypothetical protein
MLRAFWSQAVPCGVHPDDEPMIPAYRQLDWSPEEAALHAATFMPETRLHRKIHTRLFAQPFIGDLDSSYVYILYGNPGFNPADYNDEFRNHSHAEACSSNFRDGALGFFPLLAPSRGTSVANYWTARLRKLIDDLAGRLGISIHCATRIVCRRVSLIQSCAYHSKSSPGRWIDCLPSSRVARQYVQAELLPKARRREALLFVWRRASFWRLPMGSVGVLLRPPTKARIRDIFMPERQQIVTFLAKRMAAERLRNG